MTRSVSSLALLLLTGCGTLASVPMSPAQTPDSWLTIQPFVEIHLGARRIVLAQPSTTFIVFALGFITIWAGLHWLRIRGQHRTRLWWGVALLFWGAGALLAGTSYEGLSYHLKCAGRATCAWTSWLEVWYLWLTMVSVDAIVIAQAYGTRTGRGRTLQIRYAATHGALYVLAVFIGSQLPSRLLLSFEGLLLAALPSAVICVQGTLARYSAARAHVDRITLGAWLWLALTVGAYYAYYASGATETLWAHGAWFSENDVLHIGLIIWMIYLVRMLAPHTEDAATP